ncbi:hypothetical protein NHX12_005929, partial [Muraenolepis orangiensis]
MDTDLRCVFILVLFGLSLLLVSSDLRKGNYVHMGSSHHSWTDAMENCKDVFNSSLLIIENEAQDSELENKEGWIALRLMDNSQWQWPGGRPLNYSRLTDHTDVNKKCVKRKNSEWKGEDCGHDKRFFCANNKLLLIKENKTWEQALEHCRGLLGINNTKKVVGYHLVSLGTPDDYLFASEMAQDATTAEEYCDTFHSGPLIIDNEAQDMELGYDEKLLLIKENKTWEQALEHCRGLQGINGDKMVVGYDLVSLGPPDDYLFASEKALNATTTEVLDMATDLRCVFILVLLGPSLLLATSYLRNKNYVHVTEELLSWSAAQEYCDTFHSGPLIIDNEAQDMELGYHEKLLLIKENKTWEQALEHCRGLWGINRDKALVGYQLVNLGKPDDYLFASEKALNATTAE